MKKTAGYKRYCCRISTHGSPTHVLSTMWQYA